MRDDHWALLAGAWLLAILGLCLVVAGCNTMTYRTEACADWDTYADSLTTTTIDLTLTTGVDTTVVADSVLVYNCDGDTWEGQVILP